jgi:hypothetical protein
LRILGFFFRPIAGAFCGFIVGRSILNALTKSTEA